MEIELLNILKETSKLIKAQSDKLIPAFEQYKNQMSAEDLAEFEKKKEELQKTLNEINNISNVY